MKCASRIDRAVVERAAPADDPAAAGRGDVEPDLVGVGGALRERVADLERADDGLEQIGRARPQRRHVRTQRRVQFAVDRAAGLHAEDVDAGDVGEKRLLGLEASAASCRRNGRAVLAAANR